MPGPRVEALVAKLEKGGQRTQEILGGLSPQEWELVVYDDAVPWTVRDVLAQAVQWRRWSLHKLAPLSAWSRDRVVLIGDAAHPMFPYLAQGGVMALEDAWCLAREIGASRGVEERAIDAFVSERKARAAKVQAASARNGRTYHMTPPLSLARDAVLGAVPGHVLMGRLDWLYGWGQDIG